MILNHRRAIVIWLVALVVLSVGIINLSFSTQNTTASPSQKAGSSSSNAASANVGDPNVNIDIDLGSKVVKDSTIDVGVDVKIDACCDRIVKTTTTSLSNQPGLNHKIWQQIVEIKDNTNLQGQDLLNFIGEKMSQHGWKLAFGYYEDLEFYRYDVDDAEFNLDITGVSFHVHEVITHTFINKWTLLVNPLVDASNHPQIFELDFHGLWYLSESIEISAIYGLLVLTGEVIFTNNYNRLNLRLIVSNAQVFIEEGEELEFILVFDRIN